MSHCLHRFWRFCFNAINDTMTMIIFARDNWEKITNNKILSLSINIITSIFERLRAIINNSLRWFVLRNSVCESNNYFMQCSMTNQIHNSFRIFKLKFRFCRLKKVEIKSRLKSRLWIFDTLRIACNYTIFSCHRKLIFK